MMYNILEALLLYRHHQCYLCPPEALVYQWWWEEPVSVELDNTSFSGEFHNSSPLLVNSLSLTILTTTIMWVVLVNTETLFTSTPQEGAVVNSSAWSPQGSPLGIGRSEFNLLCHFRQKYVISRRKTKPEMAENGRNTSTGKQRKVTLIIRERSH